MNARPQSTAVIIPSYNLDEAYLRQALQSLKANNLAHKVILIDDGSAVKPPQLIPDLMNEIHYIELMNNNGVSAARNAGIKAAEGLGFSYIATLDGDDYAAPGRLDRQAQYLEDHADVVAVGTWTVFVDLDGHELFLFDPPTDDEGIKNYLYSNNPMHQSSIMFRLSALTKIGGYDEAIRNAEDYDIVWRIGRYGSLANIPEKLTYYRVNPAGLSLSRRSEQLSSRLKIQLRNFSPFKLRSIFGILRTLLIFILPRDALLTLKQNRGSSSRSQ